MRFPEVGTIECKARYLTFIRTQESGEKSMNIPTVVRRQPEPASGRKAISLHVLSRCVGGRLFYHVKNGVIYKGIVDDFDFFGVGIDIYADDLHRTLPRSRIWVRDVAREGLITVEVKGTWESHPHVPKGVVIEAVLGELTLVPPKVILPNRFKEAYSLD